MNRMTAVLIISVALAPCALAQGPKSLKAIEQQLTQTKSSATAAALIESIAETTPRTDEDVAALGRLLDKYPAQGQKALVRIDNPKLAGAIQKACAGKIDKFKVDKNKDWSKLPAEERMRDLNSFMASQAMITMLGRLGNRDSLPFLKQYITQEYDGTLSYTASRAIGAIAPDDPAVFQELWNNKDVKNISYGAYGPSVLKEVASELEKPGLSAGERNNIRAKAGVELLNGSTPEEKKLLEDIVLHHPDGELREQAGMAMEKALMFHPDPGDVEFVLEWTKDPKDPTRGNVFNYMRDHFDSRYVPVVLNYLKDGDVYARSGAVALSVGHNIKESLPYIKDCITKDKSAHVRGDCRIAYWKMTGVMSSEFTPEEAQDLESYLNNPRVIEVNAKQDDSNPYKKQYTAQQKALKEYKAAHHMQ